MLQIKPAGSPNNDPWISIHPAEKQHFNLQDIVKYYVEKYPEFHSRANTGTLIRKIVNQKESWRLSVEPGAKLTCNSKMFGDKYSTAINNNIIKFFYFVNSSIGLERYWPILSDHLSLIKASKATKHNTFELNIVHAGDVAQIAGISGLCKSNFPDLFEHSAKDQPSRLKIISIPHSIYEYDCLRLLRQDAQFADQDTFYCYAHAKGVSLKKPPHVRKAAEIVCSRMLLPRLSSCVDMMNSLPNIEKIGVAMSPQGFAWHNFWIATSSYIKNLSPPPITSNRYFYEYWLSGLQSNDALFSKGEIPENPSNPHNTSTVELTEVNSISLIPGQDSFNIGKGIDRLELTNLITLHANELLAKISQGEWLTQ
jgi:hypothetical protein